MLISRRAFFKFYFSIAFGAVFFVLMAVGLFVACLKEYHKGHHTTFVFFSIICCVLLYTSVYTVVRYFKNAPVIKIDKDTISFNREIFYWKDVADIKLTGKQPFKYFITFPIEGVAIKWNDGTVKYFYDDMYSNTWQLKSYISQTILKNAQSPGGPVQLGSQSFVFFKNSQFTSLRGVVLWGVILFMATMLLNSRWPKGAAVGFTFCFSTFWFIVNSSIMYYFGISEDCLIIKNHNFLWKKDVYRLDNVKEVVFETASKMPYCARIITKDFRNKLYPAATLSRQTWLQFKNSLENKGIEVRNECI